MQALGSPGVPGWYSFARGVNDSGQIVGSASTVSGMRAFRWSPVSGMIDLGDLAGGNDESGAQAINDSGQIVGYGHTATGFRAVLWNSDGSMRDLGDLPGGADQSFAFDINNAGQVVGSSSATEWWINRAFLWDSASGMQDLGDLPGGGDYSEAYAVNDSGQVVGLSATENGTQAFVWDAFNGMRALESLDGQAGGGAAYHINNSGFIVGSSTTASGDSRACLWGSDGSIHDLHSVVDASAAGWWLAEARAINDFGWIVGRGLTPEGEWHAYTLVPVPEPSSLILCGSVCLLVVARGPRSGLL